MSEIQDLLELHGAANAFFAKLATQLTYMGMRHELPANHEHVEQAGVICEYVEPRFVNGATYRFGDYLVTVTVQDV